MRDKGTAAVAWAGLIGAAVICAALAAAALPGAEQQQGLSYEHGGSCWPAGEANSGADPTVAAGASCEIRVLERRFDGSSVDVTNRAFGWAVWTPGDSTVLTVADGSGEAVAGTVSGVAPGHAVVSVLAPDTEITLSWTIEVKEVE